MEKSKTIERTEAKTRPAEAASGPKPLRPWNVVLLDDQDHTYEYVVEMLGHLFGHDRRRGFELACEVDARGRAVVATTHREHAELKVAQVRAFGADPLLARSAGPMRALLEPACGHGDADRGENHDESGESAGGPVDDA